MGSSGLASVLETHTRQEDQQRDTAKSSQERLPDPLPLHGFYSTTMKSAFCLTLVRKTTPSRGCGTGRGALWSSRKGFPSGSPPHGVEGRLGAGSVPDGQGCSPLAPSQPLPGSTFGKCPASTQWKQLPSLGCGAGRRVEISHSVPSVCVLTFLVRLYEAAGFALEQCHPATSEGFRRQEKENTRKLQN